MTPAREPWIAGTLVSFSTGFGSLSTRRLGQRGKGYLLLSQSPPTAAKLTGGKPHFNEAGRAFEAVSQYSVY